MRARRWRKLEHLVVQDIFLTETAWHADVVLPASAHAEKWGTFTNTNRQVQIGRPGARPAGRGAAGLGADPGARPAHRPELELQGTCREVFAEMAQVMPSLDNITWERLRARGRRHLSVRCARQARQRDHLRATRSRPRRAAPRSCRPTCVPPDELPDAEYPLVLTTGRLLEHWHTGSMTRRASNLDALEPEAIAGLNPREMDRLGVAPGGFISVSTRRGEVVLKARADRDVAEGMVFIPFCFAEAAANLLTNPQLDPMGKIPEFKFCAAKVEKAEMAVAAE